jgi:uncharacterized membrane protein YhiD involved in acid resistance
MVVGAFSGVLAQHIVQLSILRIKGRVAGKVVFLGGSEILNQKNQVLQL